MEPKFKPGDVVVIIDSGSGVHREDIGKLAIIISEEEAKKNSYYPRVYHGDGYNVYWKGMPGEKYKTFSGDGVYKARDSMFRKANAEEIPLQVGDKVEIITEKTSSPDGSFYGHYKGDIGRIVAIESPLYMVEVPGRVSTSNHYPCVSYLRENLKLVIENRDEEDWSCLEEKEDFSCLDDL